MANYTKLIGCIDLAKAIIDKEHSLVVGKLSPAWGALYVGSPHCNYINKAKQKQILIVLG